MRVWALVAAMTSGFAPAALALEIGACGNRGDQDGVLSDYFDKAETPGFLTYRSLDPTDGARILEFIEHCPTGQRLVVWEEHAPGLIAQSAAMDRVSAELETILSSSRRFTLARAATRLRERGLEASVEAVSFETCACYSAYPEARGSKTPYEETR